MPLKNCKRKYARASFYVLCLVLLSLMALPVSAQHEGHEGMIGWVPQELLERSVALRQGIGRVHAQVTTAVPQAQAFYDQGFAYLHSFEWIEAARSFHQALRLDPQMAMAYLGLSDAYLGLSDSPAAHAALLRAESLKEAATEAERRKIEIRGLLLAWLDSGGNMQKYFAYRKALTDAITSEPKDPWLWIQRGFADEGSPLAHGQNGGADTIAFYQTAISIAPDDFPAHHYLAHTFETIGRTQDALQQSEIYSRMAPSIPHAHHMVGHDLRRAGRTAEAIVEFERADELERSYYQAEKIPAEYDWHRVHNLSLLAMCHETLGQMKSAEKLLREAFAMPVYVDIAEFNRREWPEFLLGRHRYDEALAAAQQLTKSQWAMGRFAGHSVSARALLRLKRLDEAQAELRSAGRELEQLPTAVIAALPDAGLARAELLLQTGKQDEADQLFHRIVRDVRSVPGPDSWSQAVFQLQSIAETARESGDWGLAEFAGQQILEHDPSYAGGYFALGMAAEHRGAKSEERQQFARAEKLWQNADPDLPELAKMRQHLSAAREFFQDRDSFLSFRAVSLSPRAK